MQLLAFTLAYGAGVAAFLFVMLCGEAAMFADTPVAWMHWAITTAPCTAFECISDIVCSPWLTVVSSIKLTATVCRDAWNESTLQITNSGVMLHVTGSLAGARRMMGTG